MVTESLLLEFYIQRLLYYLYSNFKRRTETNTNLYNGVHRTGLLAKPTVDAFGHVDVVASRSPASISASFGLDGYGLDVNEDRVWFP